MRVLAAVLALAAVANCQRWQVERSRLATILFGISYVDENNGFVQGAQDGLGPLILRSTNGGSTYERLQHTGSTLMFMAGTAHSATNAVSGGVGILTSGVQYTQNGQSYTDADIPSGFPPIGATQSGNAVRNRNGVRDGAFGFVGQYGQEEGVAFSSNGGTSWNLNIVRNAPSWLRYGAYPSLTTWYVTSGTWPRKKNLKTDGPVRELNQHITVSYLNDTGRASVEFAVDPMTVVNDLTEATAEEKSGYIGGISKTIDGGRTFTTVYQNDVDGFYFNGIDCADVNNCLAVAEGIQGAYLFGTNDGGATWTQRLFLAGRSASLFDVEYVPGNPREAWAAGGILDVNFTGQFFHTTDGGMTWRANPLAGVYGTTLTFANVRGSYQGHATALTMDGQSSTLVYK